MKYAVCTESNPSAQSLLSTNYKDFVVNKIWTIVTSQITTFDLNQSQLLQENCPRLILQPFFALHHKAKEWSLTI